MNYYVAGVEFSSENSLTHYGIKGQKWGVRRFQNEDGSLTSAGRKRYKSFDELKSRDEGDILAEINKKSGDTYSQKGVSNRFKKVMKEYNKEQEEVNKLDDQSFKAYKALSDYEDKRDSSFKGLIPKKYDKQWQKLNEDYDKKRGEYIRKSREFSKKYEDKYASVMLRDLGYEDTQEARDWLKERNLVFYD